MIVLVLVAVAASAAAVWWYRTSQPEVRRPGEALEAITSRLASDLPSDAPEPHFEKVTAAAGLDGFVSFRGARSSQLPEDMGGGVAWGDFDNDGDDDLFVVAGGGPLGTPAASLAPSRLYQNLGDGRFGPAAGFPPLKIHGMAAAWGDVDGDGWLDLVVSGFHVLRLYTNHHGTFSRDPDFAEPAGFWAGVAWGDFDQDHDLDLYVCGYVRYEKDEAGQATSTEQYGTAVPFTLNPASFEPERNLLLRNDGGVFTETAALVGVANPGGRSLSALWHDFDGDGWLDLYIANDISDNVLYHNEGGETFEDQSLAAWVADYRGAMGLAAGDYDRDGDDDLFVTHWVAQENALYSSRLADRRREGPANTQAALQFSDLAARLGLAQIALPMVGWGTAFADFDGDGWLDLVVANGSTFETEDVPKRLGAQAPFLFWNQHGEHFHDLAPGSRALEKPAVGRGLAVADYDRDGDLDIAMVDLGAGVRLLRNDMQRGHAVELRLSSRGPKGKPTGRGEGAEVIAEIGPNKLRRVVASASYLSQDSALVHIGLGEKTQIDQLEVRWLGGDRQRFGALEADHVYALTEGEAEPRRVSATAHGVAPRPGAQENQAQKPDRSGPGCGDCDRGSPALDHRQRLARFWTLQRAAMDAMKRDQDPAAAADLFRQALALDPSHQDARYYLASSLEALGQTGAAAAELETLLAHSPRSHRALKQLASLRLRQARTPAELAGVSTLLERARAVNPEETGVLLLQGEVALLRGDFATAESRLEAACRSNQQAVGGFFLRAYLAHSRGDEARARSLLEQAQKARGAGWKPEGTTAEGDIKHRRSGRDESPLARFWRAWGGDPANAETFAGLERALASMPQ